MASSRFGMAQFIYRFIGSLVLVFVTYNPMEWSYYHWAVEPLMAGEFAVEKALVGLLILVGWLVLLRATQRSLGALGMSLALVFFVLLFWFLIDQGWLSLENTTTLTWLILIALAGVMALGVSWSHIRRRLSGQLDVDDVDAGEG